MGDWEKIMREVKAKAGLDEISDACARMIASVYHGGQYTAGYAFASSGAICCADEVWRDLFGPFEHGQYKTYAACNGDEKLAADMLGTYLVNKGTRGRVPGWSTLWL